MFVIIWRYEVVDSNRGPFEEIYGADGAWAKLFAKADGYLGTEVLRSEKTPGEYMTIDRWESRGDFERFKEQFGEEYRAFDEACEALTVSEEHLGDYSS
jgi:heme-degrading monooxygenase HmoA